MKYIILIGIIELLFMSGCVSNSIIYTTPNTNVDPACIINPGEDFEFDNETIEKCCNNDGCSFESDNYHAII